MELVCHGTCPSVAGQNMKYHKLSLKCYSSHIFWARRLIFMIYHHHTMLNTAKWQIFDICLSFPEIVKNVISDGSKISRPSVRKHVFHNFRKTRADIKNLPLSRIHNGVGMIYSEFQPSSSKTVGGVVFRKMTCCEWTGPSIEANHDKLGTCNSECHPLY